jgi:hypothetical protein
MPLLERILPNPDAQDSVELLPEPLNDACWQDDDLSHVRRFERSCAAQMPAAVSMQPSSAAVHA